MINENFEGKKSKKSKDEESRRILIREEREKEGESIWL